MRMNRIMTLLQKIARSQKALPEIVGDALKERESTKECIKIELPPKKRNKTLNQDEENYKTIDQILDDLDREKTVQDSKIKVKALIDKFNEKAGPISSDVSSSVTSLSSRVTSPEVIFRSRPSNEEREQSEEVETSELRYSNDLNLLLEELKKVTIAPVMSPGVTSSLITRTSSDDEVLQYLLN